VHKRLDIKEYLVRAKLGSTLLTVKLGVGSSGRLSRERQRLVWFGFGGEPRWPVKTFADRSRVAKRLP